MCKEELEPAEEAAPEKADLGHDSVKASHEEWAEIEREVAAERRKVRMADDAAMGRRAGVVGYDDVAGDDAKVDEVLAAGHGIGKSKDNAADAEIEKDSQRETVAAQSISAAASDVETLPPEGAITAGQRQHDKKRGGQKKTGSSKRRQGEEGQTEDGKKDKKAKTKDDDPDRWIKLRLQGEQKPKRIDATRIVYYHDFDGSVEVDQQVEARPRDVDADVGSREVGPSGNGNFRASVRRDLFEEDSDDP